MSELPFVGFMREYTIRRETWIFDNGSNDGFDAWFVNYWRTK